MTKTDCKSFIIFFLQIRLEVVVQVFPHLFDLIMCSATSCVLCGCNLNTFEVATENKNHIQYYTVAVRAAQLPVYLGLINSFILHSIASTTTAVTAAVTLSAAGCRCCILIIIAVRGPEMINCDAQHSTSHIFLLSFSIKHAAIYLGYKS